MHGTFSSAHVMYITYNSTAIYVTTQFATFDQLQSQFAHAVNWQGHEDGQQKVHISGESTRAFPFRQTWNKQWLLYCAVLGIRQLQLIRSIFTCGHLLFYHCLLLASPRTSCICELSYQQLQLTLLLASTYTSCRRYCLLLLALAAVANQVNVTTGFAT